MSQVSIVAEARINHGKGYARKARQAGKVPGVLYGSSTSPQSLEFDSRELDRFLGTATSARLFSVQVGDTKHTVLMKDVQRDPARGTLLHVDLHKVRLDQEVQTMVPVALTGEAERFADGGVLAVNTHALQVVCLPTQIPDSIAVDVSGLKIGDTFTVAELVLPAGISATDEPGTAIVSVMAPRVVTEETDQTEATEEAEAAAEAEDQAADE